MRYANLSKLLFACYALSLHGAGMIDIASASTNDIKAENYHASQKPVAGRIHGTITDIVAAGSIGYVEIDTGTVKAWSAGPADNSLKIGDSITISTTMRMNNFHSKTLDRDFPVIYFVQQFKPGAGPAAIPASSGENSKQAVTLHTPSSSRTSGEVKTGSYLRDAVLDGLNVDKKSLSEYRGKPLIINVWASWCGPCRSEMGSLERLAKQYDGKLYNIIGISTDDYRDKAMAFIEQTEISFNNYIDHNLMMENMLGADTIPLTVLVSADGRVLRKVRGSQEWDSPEIQEAIGNVFQVNSK